MESVSEHTSFVAEGCSWGCIYYIGLYKSFKSTYSDEQMLSMKFGGSSSGCIFALAACLNKSVEEGLSMYHELAHVADTFGVFGLMSVYHEIVLRQWLPHGGDQYLKLRDRLHINVTRFICRSEVISDWKSNDDVIDALHASMHIPFYMSYIRSVRGRWGIDGGLSQNIFKLDERTITVSATCRKGMLHPSDHLLTLSDCFSPPPMNLRMAIFSDGSRTKLPPYVAYNATMDDRVPQMKDRNTLTKVVTSTSPLYQGLFYVVKFSACSICWVLRFMEVSPFGIGALVLAGCANYRLLQSVLVKLRSQM